MSIKEGIPETGQQEQGRVLPQFEVTNPMLDKAVRYVNDSKKKFETQRSSKSEQGTNRKSFRDRLVQIDRAYRGILEADRAFKGFDDKAAPIIHDNIETIIARLKDAILFSSKGGDLVKVESRAFDANMRSAEINYQLEKLDIENKVDKFVRTVTKFGTGIIKVPFVSKERSVLTQQLITTQEQIPIIDDNDEQIIDANGQPMFHTDFKQSLEIVPAIDRKYFGAGYVVVDDIEDFYADMFIEDIQDQPIVIHKFMVTQEHILEGIEKGVYFQDQFNKVKDKITKALVDDANRRANRVVGTGRTSFNESKNNDSKPKEYLLHQAWCDFAIEVEENGEKVQRVYPCVITTIDDTCIGLSVNPYFHQMKPFIKANYRRVEGEFYGIGAVEPVLSYYHAYNDTFNQTEDNKVLRINGVTIVKGNALFDKQDFKVGPGEVWTEKETGDIRPYIVDFPMADAQQYLELLEQRINRGMGITPLLMGQGDSTDLDKTWRGTNKIIQQADKKFKDIARNIEDACIRQWAEMALKVNMQFNPVMNQGGEFEAVNAESSFVVQGVENFFEKQESIQNYINFAMQAASIPGFNIPAIINTVAEMQGIEIDEQKWGPLYTPPQPLPPEEKPLNSSVTIPIDMSKGPTMLFAASQILRQKGINIDVDSIAEATEIFAHEFDPVSKRQSGLLPPSFDSYQKQFVKEMPKGKRMTGERVQDTASEVDIEVDVDAK
jgi:hypothetical protein